MSRRDPDLPVRHMLDHAREALAMTEARTRADLDQDRQFELALTRLLEIVGEAANRVPEGMRARYPTVPWRQVVDFRNRLSTAAEVRVEAWEEDVTVELVLEPVP